MKSKSFGMKLWLYFTLFTAVIFCALWLMQTVFLQSFYNQTEINNIEKSAEHIISQQTSEELDDIIDHEAYKNSLLIFITDTDGQVIYSTDEHSYKKRRERPGVQNDNQHKPEIKPQGRQKGAERNLPDGYDDFLAKLSQSKTISYEDDTSYIYGARLDNGNALYISKSLGSVENTVGILRSQLVLITLAALVLSFIAAYFISRRFSKPVKAISEQARHIGDENYKNSFEKGFCKETDELSYTISKTSENLIKAENYRREFFANISHDLRTPLTMIKGYAEMVKDFSWEEKESRESDLDVIIKESDRLTELVNEILDYSTLQSGTKKYDMQKSNISELAKNVINQFAALAEKNGISIVSGIQKDLYAVCDRQSIARVMYNFVDNAISHSGNNKEMFVSLKNRDSKIRFEVRNLGQAIDEESLEHIWDRYFTKKQQKRNKTGTGLGLAISKEILTAHNAAYGAESAEDRGTVFWFEIMTC
ncbi:MAG: HAMP domain-containing histidine kinase [Clostridia bacterium]|nr:HAMP domain-containing histidine kinase [Clostridia bacterium]